MAATSRVHLPSNLSSYHVLVIGKAIDRRIADHYSFLLVFCKVLYLVPGNVMTHEVKDNIPIIISIFLINSD